MRRTFFKIYQNFPFFAPYWAPKGASPCIWTNMNPHHAGIFLTKFALNLLDLYKGLSPLGGAIHDPRDFIWTNLNLLALRMLHTKYQCIPASGSWEEDFWTVTKIFLILPFIGPQKGLAHLFEQIWIPSPQACFLPSLVEIGLVVLEKKSFQGKSWRRTDGRTTDAVRWHKLSWPSARWAKNEEINLEKMMKGKLLRCKK